MAWVSGTLPGSFGTRTSILPAWWWALCCSGAPPSGYAQSADGVRLSLHSSLHMLSRGRSSREYSAPRPAGSSVGAELAHDPRRLLGTGDHGNSVRARSQYQVSRYQNAKRGDPHTAHGPVVMYRKPRFVEGICSRLAIPADVFDHAREPPSSGVFGPDRRCSADGAEAPVYESELV